MSSPSIHVTDHPQKGRDQGHVTHFVSWGPSDISGMAKARIVKFCTQVDCQILAYRWQTTSKRDMVRVIWPIFNVHACNHVSKMAEVRFTKFCMRVEYIKC